MFQNKTSTWKASMTRGNPRMGEMDRGVNRPPNGWRIEGPKTGTKLRARDKRRRLRREGNSRSNGREMLPL